jgi:hypothetical protein
MCKVESSRKEKVVAATDTGKILGAQTAESTVKRRSIASGAYNEEFDHVIQHFVEAIFAYCRCLASN